MTTEYLLRVLYRITNDRIESAIDRRPTVKGGACEATGRVTLVTKTTENLAHSQRVARRTCLKFVHTSSFTRVQITIHFPSIITRRTLSSLQAVSFDFWRRIRSLWWETSGKMGRRLIVMKRLETIVMFSTRHVAILSLVPWFPLVEIVYRKRVSEPTTCYMRIRSTFITVGSISISRWKSNVGGFVARLSSLRNLRVSLGADNANILFTQVTRFRLNPGSS